MLFDPQVQLFDMNTIEIIQALRKSGWTEVDFRWLKVDLNDFR